jgi:hypothetical protein
VYARERFLFYLLLNSEMIHIMMATTTSIEIIPTATPALKIPVITEHPLKAAIPSANNNKVNLFILKYFKPDLG